jgi:hypothetical protein
MLQALGAIAVGAIADMALVPAFYRSVLGEQRLEEHALDFARAVRVGKRSENTVAPREHVILEIQRGHRRVGSVSDRMLRL